jgi:hypothetical protein
MDGQAVENELRSEAAVLVFLLVAKDIDRMTPLAAFHAGEKQALVAAREGYC